MSVKPTIVLGIINTIVAAMLIVTYNLTYVDTSNVLTDKLRESCVAVMGDGDFELITDWTAAGYKADAQPEQVKKLIKNNADGSIAFEIVTDGYAKGGIDILVAMNADGTIMGMTMISSGETPGLGSKASAPSFLELFSGKSEEVTVVKSTPSSDNEIQAITSATYSSKGVAKAANIAIKTFKEMGA